MEDKEIFSTWETFKELLRSTNRENIENLIKWLDESDFKFAPASTKYHNDMRGGLLSHSLNVYYHLLDFKNFISFFEIPQDTLIITALLHDICKVDFYETSTRNVKDERGNWTTVPYYTVNDRRPYGHAEKSIILILKSGVMLNDLEIAMIRNHMGFSKDDEMNVSKLFSVCPQSLLLHFADMTSTFISESKDLPNRFKEKLLGRNIGECLYKLSQIPTSTIEVDGTVYKLANNEPVDNKKVILIKYNNTDVAVYSPHGDGLPF